MKSERFTHTFSLEDILVEKSSSTSIGNDLTILLDAIHQPNNFNLYGVSYNDLNESTTLTFIMKVFEKKTNYKHEEYFILLLIKKMRKLLCSHTENFIMYQNWDSFYFEMLVNGVLKSHPIPCWKRICKDIMVRDLNNIDNIDGMHGLLHKLKSYYDLLINLISDGNIIALKEVSLESRSIEPWISLSQITYSLFSKWTILHYAASITSCSIELLQCLVSVFGCSLLERDSKCRTPLHIAAACMNYEVILYLTHINNAACRVYDSAGQLPLHCLLHTLSVSKWTRRISSKKLEEIILALISEARYEILWNCSYVFESNLSKSTEIDSNTICYQNQYIASMKSSLFYASVVYTDDCIAETIIKLTRSTSKTTWNKTIIEETIYQCIKAGRYITVDVLIREFFELLELPVSISNRNVDSLQTRDEVNNQEGDDKETNNNTTNASTICMLDFLDTCLCYCVTANMLNIKILGLLLEHYHRIWKNHIDASNKTTTDDDISITTDPEGSINDNDNNSNRVFPIKFIHYSLFIYLAIIKEDETIISSIINYIPKSLLRTLIYPLEFNFFEEINKEFQNINEFKFSYNFQLRVLRYCSLFTSLTNIKCMNNFMNMSPISMICMLGNEKILQIILRSTNKERLNDISKHYHMNDSEESTNIKNQNYIYPLLYSIYYGNSNCFKILKNLLDDQCFINLCYKIKVLGNCNLFMIYINMIRDNMILPHFITIRTKRTPHQHNIQTNKDNKVVNYIEYLEILTLFLEPFQRSNDINFNKTLTDINDYRNIAINDISFTTCSEKYSILNNRKNDITASIQQIHLDVLKDTSLLNTNDIITSMIDNTCILYQSCMKQWKHQSNQWNNIIQTINSKYFQISLKLICKKQFKPDKTWLKLCYCFNYIYDILSRKNVISLEDPNKSYNNMITIDMKTWNRFISIIQQSMQSDTNYKQFLELLSVSSTNNNIINSLKNNHFINNVTRNEYFDIRNITKHVWNEINTIFYSENLTNVTILLDNKSKTNKNLTKAHSRILIIYQLFFDWIERILTDIKLHHDLLNESFVLNPKQQNSQLIHIDKNNSYIISIHKYQHYQYLLQYYHTLEAITSNMIIDSNININNILESLFNKSNFNSYQYDKFSLHMMEWNKFINMLQFNGINNRYSKSCNNYSEKHDNENYKKSKFLLLEKILIIFIEKYQLLNNSTSCLSLIYYILPLSCLQMWNVLKVLFNKIMLDINQIPNSQKESLNNILKQMNYVMITSSKLSTNSIYQFHTYYEDYLYETLSTMSLIESQQKNKTNQWEQASDNQFYCLTPLHFFMKYNQKNLLIIFLQLFPKYVFNMEELIIYAQELNSCDMIKVLVTNSENSINPIARNSINSFIKDSNTFDTKRERKNACNLFISSNLHQQCSNIYQVLQTIQSKIKITYDTEERSDYFYISPFVCTWCPSTYEKQPSRTMSTAAAATTVVLASTTCLCVVLMDGTLVPWEQLMSNASLIARALPSAIEVKGIGSTGNTLLHEAMRMDKSSLDLAYWLLMKSNDKQHPHNDGMFTVDSTGYTPIYHAINHQHYDIVIEVLNKYIIDANTLPMNQNQLSHLLLNHTISNCIHHIDSNQIFQPILNEIKELAIPSIPNASIGNTKLSKSLLFKDCKSNLDILSIYLQYTELYWNKLLQCNSMLLIQVCQFNGFGELDSIKRARQILGLLGIPLSQLSFQDKDIMNKNYSRNLKDFNNLTPSKIKKLLSWVTCQQIRNILCGWYRSRCNPTSKPSYIEDSLLLFHRIDISISELGQSGKDISYYDRNEIAMKQDSNELNHLCEQLKLEFLLEKTSNGYENIIPLNENIRSNNIKSSTLIDKVTYFFKSQDMNVNTCKEILNISYIILDFARLLCISRYYTSITQEISIVHNKATIPIPNKDIVITTSQHPLDCKLLKYKQLNEEIQRIKTLLPATFPSAQPQPPKQPHNDLMISEMISKQGIKTRIQICDFITTEDLHAFYLIDSKISERFNNLRSFITEGLSSILLDLGSYQLSEFLCRVLINPKMNYINDHSLNNPITYDHNTSTTNNTTSNTSYHHHHQVLRSKFSKITNSEYGINQILLFLQKINLEDIIKSNSKYENLNQFQITHVDAIKLLTYDYHPNKDYYQKVINITQQQFNIDQNEIDTINKLIDVNVTLRDCLYNSSSNNIEKDMDGNKKKLTQSITISKRNNKNQNVTMVNSLKHSYETAKTLFHFIQSIIGLLSKHTYAKIYHQDLHENLRKYKNVLTPLCYNYHTSTNNNQENDQNHIKYRNNNTSKSTQSTRLKICNLLLELGADPLSDSYHILDNNLEDSCLTIDNPIIIASMEGQSQLLKLMLLKCNSIHIKNNINIYQNNSKYLFLIWHVLMNYQENNMSQSDINYLECIELLINHKFSLQNPSSFDGTSKTISCLELITLYQIEINDYLFEIVVNQENSIEIIIRSLHYMLISNNNISQKKIEFLINRIQGNDIKMLLTTNLSINHNLFHDNQIITNISIHLEYIKKLYCNNNHKLSNTYNVNDKEKLFESICKKIRKQMKLYLIKMKSKLFIKNDIQTILDNLQQYEKTVINTSIIDHIFNCHQVITFKYTTSYHILEVAISTSNDVIAELICKLILPTFQNVMLLDQNLAPYLTTEFSNIEHVLHIACMYNVSSVFYAFASLFDNTNIESTKYISIRRWLDILDTSYMISIPYMVVTTNKIFKKPMNMLELALEFGSAHIIKYLLTINNISILPKSIMKAVIKGKLNESMILELLQVYLTKENIKSYEDIKDIFVITIKHNDTMNNTIIETIETLLHVSCRRGYSSIVTLLLELGANPLETERNPWSILDELEIKDQFESNNTTNNVSTLKDLTALQCSIISGHGKVTKVLFKACSDAIKHAIELMIYTIRRYILNKYRYQSLTNIKNKKNSNYNINSNNGESNFKF